MIFRKLAFVLVILFFSGIAVIMVSDLLDTEKKMHKKRKKDKINANEKKTHYRNHIK